jgi:hypothetical protein
MSALNPSRVLSTAGTEPKVMHHGVYIGSVVNANDPQNRSRVKLYIPQVLGNAVSNWAVPLGFGVSSVPVPGAIVHAMFTGGDINYPIYSTGT